MNFSPSGYCFDDLYPGLEQLLQGNPGLQKLPQGELRWHLMWYWNRGTMSWVMNPEGECTGVCLIKLFNDLKDMDDWYVHDPDGQYLFIEEAVSDGPVTWRSLFDQLYEVWGPREFMLWDRQDRTKKCPRIYTWERYLEILRRLTMKKEDR